MTETQKLLAVLVDVLEQACGNGVGELDSMGLSAYETGISILLEYKWAAQIPAGRLIAMVIRRE